MNAVLETISQVGILPVIKINDSARAAGLGKALSAGGIPVAEITFRTEAAERSIYEIANQVPEVCVGAGTVLTVEQAKAAVAAGARFLVSPGFNPTVTSWCIENHVPIVPGCATPTEVEAAMGLGLRVLKFFPAEAAGGVAMLKSLASPYSSIRFIPTGGITPQTLGSYLSLGNVLACGGSWMVPESLLDNGCFPQITALCQTAVQEMLGLSLMQVGIGTEVTALPSFLRGEPKQIVMKARDIPRTIAYFERMGMALDQASAARDEKGNILSLLFREQVGGFTLQLCKQHG